MSHLRIEFSIKKKHFATIFQKTNFWPCTFLILRKRCNATPYWSMKYFNLLLKWFSQHFTQHIFSTEISEAVLFALIFFCSCKSCLCSLASCSLVFSKHEHCARSSRILVKGMKFNTRKGFGDEKHWLLFSCVNAKKKRVQYSQMQRKLNCLFWLS